MKRLIAFATLAAAMAFLALAGAGCVVAKTELQPRDLTPYVRWNGAGVTRPGQVGAHLSPLSAVLTGEKHGKYVKVPDEDLRTIYLWLDAHVPFYGTYEEKDVTVHGRKNGLRFFADRPIMEGMGSENYRHYSKNRLLGCCRSGTPRSAG